VIFNLCLQWLRAKLEYFPHMNQKIKKDTEKARQKQCKKITIDHDVTHFETLRPVDIHEMMSFVSCIIYDVNINYVISKIK